MFPGLPSDLRRARPPWFFSEEMFNGERQMMSCRHSSQFEATFLDQQGQVQVQVHLFTLFNYNTTMKDKKEVKNRADDTLS